MESTPAIPHEINIEELLAPISQEEPAGEWLRYQEIYDRIQDARREDDASIPQGVWESPLKRANWLAVDSLCQDVLIHRSKDLQIGAWLLEAWFHMYALPGVEQGLFLLRELCDRFWEPLYPRIEGGDAEFRLGPITWVDEKVSLKLKRLPITEPVGGDARSYTLAEWESIAFKERGRKQDPTTDDHPSQGNSQSVLTLRAQLMVSASLTPKDFYQGRAAALLSVKEAATQLEEVLDRQLEREAVMMHQLRGVIAECQRVNDQLQSAAGFDDEEPEQTQGATPEQQEGEGEADGHGGGGSGGPIRSRGQAYQRLIEAADYLLRTEPHSPTPYLVKRAVAWGSMTLTELLAELVQSPDDLKGIYTLLGVHKHGE